MVSAASSGPDVRAQVSMVFHLDKCIGCHTCSLACKNIWTDRPGAEYMWWNNVETKPGTGYPTRWEDQQQWRGGWETDARGSLRLRSQGRAGALLKLFHNSRQPGLDDYYHPWTYRYRDLFDAATGDDLPTAVPVSQITGEVTEIKAGPNWDDDLSGSPLYAWNDPDLEQLSDEERRTLFEVERMTMAYLPRICNHCLNPSCVASCPSGAIYKRGEDGVVLIDQERCRGWRACVVGCPYKKTYYNWRTGKSEKCILCYPRLESGEPPACFHACVGRIRFMGVLLYDASGIEAAARAPAASLVAAQRQLILDPRDPAVAEAARRCGVGAAVIDAAVRSPVLRFVKDWQLALPLHPEYRTVPMLFYVPPLMPVVGRTDGGIYGRGEAASDDLFAAVEQARLSIRYLSRLFSCGEEEPVAAALRRLVAVRMHRRAREIDDLGDGKVARALEQAGLTPTEADEIYRLTTLATHAERAVLPPLAREQAASARDPDGAEARRQSCGFGVVQSPERGS